MSVYYELFGKLNGQEIHLKTVDKSCIDDQIKKILDDIRLIELKLEVKRD